MKCRICSCEDLDAVIDLGNQPWGNHFLTKEESARSRSTLCVWCIAITVLLANLIIL